MHATSVSVLHEYQHAGKVCGFMYMRALVCSIPPIQRHILNHWSLHSFISLMHLASLLWSQGLQVCAMGGILGCLIFF